MWASTNYEFVGVPLRQQAACMAAQQGVGAWVGGSNHSSASNGMHAGGSCCLMLVLGTTRFGVVPFRGAWCGVVWSTAAS